MFIGLVLEQDFQLCAINLSCTATPPLARVGTDEAQQQQQICGWQQPRLGCMRGSTK